VSFSRWPAATATPDELEPLDRGVEQQTDTFEAFAIPGAEPIFVKKAGVGFVYEDSGRAIGAGAFPKPPTPIYHVVRRGERVTSRT
jgi:hypothetical protein